MTRTLETTAGCFGSAIENNGANVFMNPTTASPDFSAQHKAVAMPPVPVVTHELCRETIGVRLQSFVNSLMMFSFHWSQITGC
jgi:molybdopterin-biosynthesis enzyme MoeA-like protein